MALQNFSIEIYDTTLPAWELVPLEYAEAATINLSWSGSDSKMQLIKSSVLDFSMEVNMAQPTSDEVGFTTDAWFSNLFTGNETKFAVFIKDEDTDKTIWTGFLLPEQYREPYTQGTFYVNFTATDGLARLKGKELPEGMYRGRSSIAHIIANCLKLTGLYKQIYVAQAIENAGQSGAYKHIDKWFYNLAENETKGTKKDAYTILEDVLTLMGCTLFQQDNRWYVVGWNQFYKSVILFDVYSPEGVRYTLTGPVSRPGRILQFEATPDVSIKAPFKRVAIESPFAENLQFYIPDIATQEWSVFTFGQFPDVAKNWRIVNLDTEVFFLMLIPVNDSIYDNYTESSEPLVTQGYAAAFKGGSVTINSFTGWIEPAHKIYLKEGMKVSLFIEFYLKGAVENVDNDNLKYAVLIDDTVIYSNRSGIGNEIQLDFKGAQSSGLSGFQNTAVLDVKEFTVPSSGFFSVRIYPLQDVNLNPYFAVRDLKIELIDPEKESIQKVRQIDFATEETIKAEVKDSVIYNASSFVLDDFRTGYNIVSVFLLPVPTIKTNTFGLKRNFSNALGIPLSFIPTLQANLTKLFLLRKDTDYFERLMGPHLETDAAYPQGYLFLNLPDDYRMQAGDRLYYNSSAGATVFDANKVFSREVWKKTEADTGNKRLHECLAEVVHDIHPRELIQLEGDVEGLIFPLDQMKFYYKNSMRSLMSLRIDITMDRGVTRLTAIEDITQKVEDYV